MGVSPMKRGSGTCSANFQNCAGGDAGGTNRLTGGTPVPPPGHSLLGQDGGLPGISPLERQPHHSPDNEEFRVKDWGTDPVGSGG